MRGRSHFCELFSDAKPAENQIQDVVIGSRAGDFIEWPKRAVKIQQ
jgi:hypothetical protein